LPMRPKPLMPTRVTTLLSLVLVPGQTDGPWRAP
jgi:hypothetical protein